MSGRSFMFESGAVTHQGRVRTLNEDRILVEPAAGLWLVADGMGGHNAGDMASAEIVAQLSTIGVSSSASDQHARFVDRLARANRKLQDFSRRNNGLTVGSTVAALLAFEGQYRCLWMGDSRVYLIRKGTLRQLSRDHSEVQELLDQGALTPEEARSFAGRNVITRAVGVDPELALDFAYGEMEFGDSYLLCSDGLTAHCSDEDILGAVNGRVAQQVCDLLLQMTLERGGTDNVSVIVVQCRNADLTIPVGAIPTPSTA